ncbi:MAG: nitroreductase family protein [Deltaproteobacteria bacterium]|nr:nitroreductase family protein [Deltaproteobacteria bacterium]
MRLSLQAIRDRRSCRTFDGEPPAPEAVVALERAFVEASPGPFGGRVRFALAGRPEAPRARIGTYGVVRGAVSYVAGAVERGERACIDYGYCLEGVVLRATELGLATCWLGGTFDRGAAREVLGAGPEEFCPAATPVGHPARKPGLQDRVIRMGARATTRKDPGELFFEILDDQDCRPLEDPGAWAGVLEAVRIGPSASNRQPWRLFLDRRSRPEALHLLLDEDRFYNNMLGAVKLQELDMGIAMRHVEVACAELGIPGQWQQQPPPRPARSLMYVATWA